MNSFVLKILAIITMFLDHAGKIVTPAIYPLTYIGRIAFPIFSFQASLGYEHTKNLKKYITRMLIFAIISQIPYYLYFSEEGLNVIFTLLLGIISIYIYEELTKRYMRQVGIILVAFLAFLAEMLKCDYGCYGVFLVFLFHIAKDHKILMTFGFIFATFILYFNKMLVLGYAHEVYIWHMICAFFAIIPILFYNKKEGKKTRYFLYIFYPAHLLLLYLIKVCFIA